MLAAPPRQRRPMMRRILLPAVLAGAALAALPAAAAAAVVHISSLAAVACAPEWPQDPRIVFDHNGGILRNVSEDQEFVAYCPLPPLSKKKTLEIRIVLSVDDKEKLPDCSLVTAHVDFPPTLIPFEFSDTLPGGLIMVGWDVEDEPLFSHTTVGCTLQPRDSIFWVERLAR